jgi:hypothetical protein
MPHAPETGHESGQMQTEGTLRSGLVVITDNTPAGLTRFRQAASSSSAGPKNS